MDLVTERVTMAAPGGPKQVLSTKLVLVSGTHRVVDPSSDVDIAWVRARVEDVGPTGMVLAESVVGFAFEACRVAALCETTRAEGVLWGMCRVLGIRHKFYSAKQVRAALCYDPVANDAMVACVTEHLFGKSIREQLKATGREHVYDAMLLAAHGLCLDAGVKIVLPAKIHAELARLKSVAKAASSVKKAQRAMAAPCAVALAGAARSGVIPSLVEVQRLMGGVPTETVVTALRVVARGRLPVGQAAREVLARAGVPTVDPSTKRSLTRMQRGRRSEAAKGH